MLTSRLLVVKAVNALVFVRHRRFFCVYCTNGLVECSYRIKGKAVNSSSICAIPHLPAVIYHAVRAVTRTYDANLKSSAPPSPTSTSSRSPGVFACKFRSTPRVQNMDIVKDVLLETARSKEMVPALRAGNT